MEAQELGVSVMLLAGGEPMMRRRILETIDGAPEILFLLFTNGSLIDETVAVDLAKRANVVPVVSQEGGPCETDARRGEGMHRRVSEAMARLKTRKVFFGTSMTLTSRNLETATDEATIRRLMRDGCRLFYFINYVPVEPGTDDLQVSQAQVDELDRRLTEYRKRIPALFIAFPHDEVALGGCLAAGRGFVHIDARGDVQPCPFSPYADRNVQKTALRDALASPLLAAIRESDVRLDETDGRCALWKRRAWVESLRTETDDPAESP